MSIKHQSLCRSTQLLQCFFLTQVIKLLTIVLVFKDVSSPCWFIYGHIFRRLTWVVTWHFSSKNLLCQPRQMLRWHYNAVPMWLCQVSSIHIELCIASDLNNKLEVFFMDNEFDLGDGWLSISIAFFSDSIYKYVIKSASFSFIQANTFIKLFFKYAHWLDTFKTSWPQLLR